PYRARSSASVRPSASAPVRGPGHDDMLAILLAAKHLDVVAITTVHGNQSLAKVTSNTLKIVELGSLQHIPVSRGLAKPLLGEAVHAPEVHGESGLDGVDLPEASVETTELDAVQTIIEMSHRYDDLVLVPTGPLTNIAAALTVDPTLAERVTEISLMGGSLTFGNSTPAAEFNIWVDPEAADIVFTSGIPIQMFGLNVTRQASATPERIQSIREQGGAVAGTVADLLDFYQQSLFRVYGLEGASLHDPLAVATLIRPELFEMRPMHVGIELNGTRTRGMTVCDYRHTGQATTLNGQSAVRNGSAANARVAVGIDVDGFFALLSETLGLYA
ncbi:MAG: Inosine-uridine preferring nucleoside hydrolase, partial [Frondihabitans sp.]|nr:Inosine-uridine preferring nucleoside hydrolase [Frondihabitans sp.]